MPGRFATRPLGRSLTIQQEEFSVLRYFRKLLSSSRTDGIRAIEPRDPLDVCLFILFPLRFDLMLTYSALLPRLAYSASYLQYRSPT